MTRGSVSPPGTSRRRRASASAKKSTGMGRRSSPTLSVKGWSNTTLDVTLQGLTIPFCQLRGSFISFLQKIEQEPVRVFRLTHGVIGQDELSEPLVVEGVGRGEVCVAVTDGLRISVDKECGTA